MWNGATTIISYLLVLTYKKNLLQFVQLFTEKSLKTKFCMFLCILFVTQLQLLERYSSLVFNWFFLPFELFLLQEKFTQNRQNKQRHFYSTGKIACRLFKSIIDRNIHMACSWNRKILSGLCAQREGDSAVQAM